jgi:hypothetical protein
MYLLSLVYNYYQCARANSLSCGHRPVATTVRTDYPNTGAAPSLTILCRQCTFKPSSGASIGVSTNLFKTDVERILYYFLLIHIDRKMRREELLHKRLRGIIQDLPNSMELSSSWEAIRRSDTQEFSSVIWTQKNIYSTHKGPSLVSILSHINSVNITLSYF